MYDKLGTFFESYPESDIFCFQEVYNSVADKSKEVSVISVKGYQPKLDLFTDLKESLPSSVGRFCQTLNDTYGIAIFLKKDIEILNHGEVLIARGDWDTNEDINTKDHHRKLQWVELRVAGKKFLVANAHLTHRPEGKGDSEKRVKQSQAIINFLAMFDCPKVLVGDFNLKPDTESIRMLEKAGMRNLIKEYNILCTRTELYRSFKTGSKFANYIFASPDIKVNACKVLPDVVSDHSPVFVDFDLI